MLKNAIPLPPCGAGDRGDKPSFEVKKVNVVDATNVLVVVATNKKQGQWWMPQVLKLLFSLKQV